MVPVAMRFAAQRLLAELPTSALSGARLEAIAEAAMELDAARTMGQLVGQPVNGQQLLMQLRPAGLMLPFDAADARQLGARQVTQQAEQLLDEPPQAVREVLFGWVPEGQGHPDLPRKMSYQQQSGAGPAKAELEQAMRGLVERAGMQSGDLLVNTPYGLMDGDYRRALAYMRQGFGAPDAMGQQLARIGTGGQLVPEQVLSTLPALTERMGWRAG